MSKIISRRSHKRFKAKDGAFAVLYQNSSKLAQIIDISMAGFSFRYSDSQFIDNDRDGQAFLYHDHRQRLEDFSNFDIFLVDSGIYLDQIPCKIVSNFDLEELDDPNSIPMKRCCIQFDELVPDQISDLAYFIKNCTSDAD
ncbi:MAG: hypothetical protein JRF56_20745 [Deltaproteobacteria bacterium]|jgi:hypothetical protein|nr:hypothetical protein [Deltaproteobacteria bacterium]